MARSPSPRGLDNTIWYVQPGVQGWQTSGQAFIANGNPSIAELPNGNVVIAARGANSNTIWYTIPGQQGWTSTGPAYIATSDPAVGVSASGTITIAVLGLDNTIWYVQPGVQGWQTSGQAFIANGNPVNCRTAKRQCRHRCPGGQLQHHLVHDPWATRMDFKPSVIATSDPAVGVSASGTITIAAGERPRQHHLVRAARCPKPGRYR